MCSKVLTGDNESEDDKGVHFWIVDVVEETI